MALTSYAEMVQSEVYDGIISTLNITASYLYMIYNTVMARSQESTKPARTPGAPKKLAILNALYMPSAVKLKPLFDIQNM